jgi:DNA-binding transcriptional ArsR family regulator
MASDLLSTIQSEIDTRLNELRPLLVEYEQLLEAVDALLDTDHRVVPTSVTPKAQRLPRATRARRAPRGSAAGAIALAAGEPAADESEPTAVDTEQPVLEVEKPIEVELEKAPRAQRGAAREAILAALDHGSHTVGELVVVTAMSAPNLTGNLRRLASEGKIVKTEREGKTAYALPVAA